MAAEPMCFKFHSLTGAIDVAGHVSHCDDFSQFCSMNTVYIYIIQACEGTVGAGIAQSV
jgi:hypothetical protein